MGKFLYISGCHIGLSVKGQEKKMFPAMPASGHINVT